MSSEKYLETCRRALEAYGSRNQIEMCFEEMAELTQALCKHLRGKPNHENICEEIADVQIMLWQMMILMDRDGGVERQIEAKIKRLEKRMETVSGIDGKPVDKPRTLAEVFGAKAAEEYMRRQGVMNSPLWDDM